MCYGLSPRVVCGAYETFNRMKNNYLFLLFVLFVFGVVSCSEGADEIAPADGSEKFVATDGLARGEAGGDTGGQTGEPDQSGLVTAGEWNDLDNWDFWTTLIEKDENYVIAKNWGFNTKKRYAVKVRNGAEPVINAKVELREGTNVAWTAITDNMGSAELWADVFISDQQAQSKSYKLYVNNVLASDNPLVFRDGVNELTYTEPTSVNRFVEVAFLVDATGSMGDELEFLKDDLKSVVQEVISNDKALRVLTATVFYRDKGDEYIVRHSPFTFDIASTVNFIQKQSAAGGGDFPEAVDVALETGLTELQWTESSRTRIAFLLLDAPPHMEQDNIDRIQRSIKLAASKGVKIIPITASGIGTSTEFLTRMCAITTNGTYTFITNHSGIGGEHHESTVGDYQVEYLNKLMVRLIKKYSE